MYAEKLREVLRTTHGDVEAAAARMGKARRTIYDWLRVLGLTAWVADLRRSYSGNARTRGEAEVRKE